MAGCWLVLVLELQNCAVSAQGPLPPSQNSGDKINRVVMASMRHEVCHSHRSAAQVGHIRPTCRQEYSDAASTHDDPRGDFRHQHAPRTGMSIARTVASMSSIVATMPMASISSGFPPHYSTLKSFNSLYTHPWPRCLSVS